MRLKDKIAIITGSGRGIGRATAVLFAAEGAKVIINDIDEKNAKETCSHIVNLGQEANYFIADVSKNSDVKDLVNFTISKYKTIDILVNNASIVSAGTVTETNEEEWDKVIRISLKSVFLCSKRVIPHMISNNNICSIINISSTIALVGTKQTAAYAAAKGGVMALSRQMALDFAPKIRVNSICPGWTATDMLIDYFNSRSNPEEAKKFVNASIPNGRMGEPNEIAHACLFLASQESSNIIGIALPVDGGFIAQ